MHLLLHITKATSLVMTLNTLLTDYHFPRVIIGRIIKMVGSLEQWFSKFFGLLFFFLPQPTKLYLNHNTHTPSRHINL